MDLTQLFEKAVADSKTLPEKPANNILLKLYSLYKQATIGDVNVEAPVNSFDFVARAKHSAWEELKGRSKEESMQEYIDLVHHLQS